MKNKRANNTESCEQSLVGMYVFKMIDGTNRLNWEGRIALVVDNLVFIRFFDALVGCPTYMRCVNRSELCSENYKFFSDREDAKGYYDAYQRYHDMHYDEEMKATEERDEGSKGEEPCS